MAKLRIQGDSTGYVDLSAPNSASSRTIDVDQLPELNQANTFTQNQLISGGDAITQEIRSSGNQTHFRMVSDLNNSAWMISNESNADRMRIMHTNTSTSTNTFPMYIYEAGYVTTPAQPMCLIRKTQGQSSSGGSEINPVTFDGVRDNIGNHYSTATNKFTAPFNGTYCVSFQIFGIRNSANYLSALLTINGSNIANIACFQYSMPSWAAYGQTFYVTLIAGDSVGVKVAQDSNASLDNTGYFSVYLVG